VAGKVLYIMESLETGDPGPIIAADGMDLPSFKLTRWTTKATAYRQALDMLARNRDLTFNSD